MRDVYFVLISRRFALTVIFLWVHMSNAFVWAIIISFHIMSVWNWSLGKPFSIYFDRQIVSRDQILWFLQKYPHFANAQSLESTYLQMLLMTVVLWRMGQSGLGSGFGSTSLSDGVFPIAFQNHLVDWWASIVVGRLLSYLQAIPVCFFLRKKAHGELNLGRVNTCLKKLTAK